MKIYDEMLNSFLNDIAPLFSSRYVNEPTKEEDYLPQVEDYFSYGSNPDDVLIFHEIEKYKEASEKKEILCLEVGAGNTYGANYNFGCPWFFRMLSKKEGIRVIASDILVEPNETRKDLAYAHFYVSPEDILYYLPVVFWFCEEHEQPFWERVEQIPISDFCKEKGCFLPVAPERLKLIEEIMPLFGRDEGMYEKRSKFFKLKTGHDIFSEGVNYVRPFVDKFIEDRCFELDIRTGLDFTRLTEYFEPESVDIIVSRNLGPVGYSYMRLAKTEFAKVLVQGGKVLMAKCAGWDSPDVKNHVIYEKE